MSKSVKKVRIFSALEVANLCGVVNQTAINWIRNGYLKAFTTPGGQYRIYAEDLVAFLEKRGMRVPPELEAQCKDDVDWSSLVVVDGQVRGSRMLAQATEDPRFFWCRPSATATFPTHALASGGSCLAVSNPALKELIAQRVKVLQVSDPGNTAPIPQELVTASASGLDPDLSPEGARWQIRRIARARRACYISAVAAGNAAARATRRTASGNLHHPSHRHGHQGL